MKKFLMIVAMCCLTMATAQAQEVFKELLKSAKEIAEDKSKDIETRKIATFKFDELSYMAMKVRDDVLRDRGEIRRRIASGTTLREIAREYGIHRNTLINYLKSDN